MPIQSAADIRAVKFARQSGFQHGYDKRTVDGYLERSAALAEGTAAGQLDPVAIRSAQFPRPTGGLRGYDRDQVNAFLGDLAASATNLNLARPHVPLAPVPPASAPSTDAPSKRRLRDRPWLRPLLLLWFAAVSFGAFSDATLTGFVLPIWEFPVTATLFVIAMVVFGLLKLAARLAKHQQASGRDYRGLRGYLSRHWGAALDGKRKANPARDSILDRHPNLFAFSGFLLLFGWVIVAWITGPKALPAELLGAHPASAAIASARLEECGSKCPTTVSASFYLPNGRTIHTVLAGDGGGVQSLVVYDPAHPTHAMRLQDWQTGRSGVYVWWNVTATALLLFYIVALIILLMQRSRASLLHQPDPAGQSVGRLPPAGA